MRKIFTTAITKGGCGKTSTAAALAQAATADGLRVLAVDLDPHANLTAIMGADPNRPGVFEALHGGDPAKLIQKTGQGVYVLSAAPSLAAEKTSPASGKRLKNALEPIMGSYDLAFIDCPPTSGEMVFNALFASTVLIIPVETDLSAIQGLYGIMDLARIIQRNNPGLSEFYTILTRYDGRSKINRFMKDQIQQTAAAVGAPLIGEIHNAVAVREAQAMKQSLFDYAPRSKPASQYLELYKKIMEA